MGYGCDIEDVGGDMANSDFEAERLYSILKDREERLADLKGKYVITCIGSKSRKKCYLQDRSINDEGWWTQYLSNALGFVSEKAAKDKCKQFKYNKCSVELV